MKGKRRARAARLLVAVAALLAAGCGAGHGSTSPLRDGAFGLHWAPRGPWLAFSEGRALVLAHEDGTARRILSRNAGGFSWAPDGTAIAYTVYGKGGAPPSVWVARLGRSRRRIGAGSAPAWSPDGRTIALVRNAAIWRVRPDGSGARRISAGRPSAPDDAPEWSPDGRRLVFVRGCCTEKAIWVSGADGVAARRVGPGDDPHWAPLGTAVVYVGPLGAHGFGRIYKADLARNVFYRLTPKQGCRDEQPALSPNGPLAFVRVCQAGRGGVHLIRGREFQAYLVAAGATSPVWSPDGRLGFSRGGKLYVANPDGTNVRPVGG